MGTGTVPGNLENSRRTLNTKSLAPGLIRTSRRLIFRANSGSIDTNNRLIVVSFHEDSSGESNSPCPPGSHLR